MLDHRLHPAHSSARAATSRQAQTTASRSLRPQGARECASRWLASHATSPPANRGRGKWPSLADSCFCSLPCLQERAGEGFSISAHGECLIQINDSSLKSRKVVDLALRKCVSGPTFPTPDFVHARRGIIMGGSSRGRRVALRYRMVQEVSCPRSSRSRCRISAISTAYP